MDSRGRVLAQIGEVIMAVNVVCSDPLDGRAWTIVEPVMEGMGWHVVRVEEDCYTLTTIAVADSEGAAVAFIRAARDADDAAAVSCNGCGDYFDDGTAFDAHVCADSVGE